ncbi:MAG TPA: tyrosine-type recombinase/integrase [Pyrinomonadaceae bacterium]
MAKQRNGYTFENKGKWYARITFTDNNGKRRNIKRTCLNEADAKKTLKSILRELEDEGEQIFDTANLTVNDLIDYYDKNFCQPAQYANGRKISGLRDVSRAKSVLPHFRDFFGSKKLRVVTYGDLASYRRMRMSVPTHMKQPRTDATMNRELGILRRIFNIAVSENWIKRNPFNCGEPLIIPSAENIREKILTFDEEQKLLSACEEPCRIHIRPIIIALLDTGARRGEMLKLTWQNVNFELRVITIIGETTKTLKTRQVAMTQRLFDELSILWEKSNKDFSARVFPFKVFRKSFQTACKIAGIKSGGIDGLVTHSLRHSTATRLVKGNLPIQLIGRILGHQQPQTTYRYLSANDETLRQAASILESIQDKSE